MIPDPAVQPFLTIEETAPILRLSRSACYEAAARGDIPTVRMSAHRIRVPTAALRRMAGLDSEAGPASPAVAPSLTEGTRREQYP